MVEVWKPSGISVDEHCLITRDGNYIGIRTGTLYLKGRHYHSPVYLAKVVAANVGHTGMFHRCEPYMEEIHDLTVGCFIEVVKAHLLDGKQVWRSVPDRLYFSSEEIELLSDEPIR